MSTDTYLPPIGKPQGLMMKLAYYFTRRQFGKVLTPLKVHSARLPAAFGLFYAKVGKLDKQLTLSAETIMLVREQVARINVCLFCIDIGRAFTIQASMNQLNSTPWSNSTRARCSPTPNARPWLT